MILGRGFVVAQMYINEIRIFLYHFTLSKGKPPRWDGLKAFLSAGISLHAIDAGYS